MSQNEEEDSYGLCHQFSEFITKLKFSYTGNLYLFLGLQIDGEIKRLIAQPIELLTEICKQKFSFKTGPASFITVSGFEAVPWRPVL
jgi:hypothetical protein